MWNMLGKALEPVLTRLGTGTAGLLVGYGIENGHANAIGLGLTSLVLVGVDVATRYLIKRNK